MGGIFVYKKFIKKDVKIFLIVGYMDEVGLMVKYIRLNGVIEVFLIGGLLGDVFIF